MYALCAPSHVVKKKKTLIHDVRSFEIEFIYCRYRKKEPIRIIQYARSFVKHNKLHVYALNQELHKNSMWCANILDILDSHVVSTWLISERLS